MISFFLGLHDIVYAVGTSTKFSTQDREKLSWLFGQAEPLDKDALHGHFVGPRREMITPWSTNAVEITQNMGISGIYRIEEFHRVGSGDAPFDRMLQMRYDILDQDVFTIKHDPEQVSEITDIKTYNKEQGLALSDEEIEYLSSVSNDLGRPLTDSEVFGFSQVNSEHCRHKIFNGQFVIDGKAKERTLFQLIKETSKQHPNRIVSAYKDNVAFVQGPQVDQFAPKRQDIADFFRVTPIKTLKLKHIIFLPRLNPLMGQRQAPEVRSGTDSRAVKEVCP